VLRSVEVYGLSKTVGHREAHVDGRESATPVVELLSSKFFGGRLLTHHHKKGVCIGSVRGVIWLTGKHQKYPTIFVFEGTI
jgi:hypothetical protein